MVELVDELGFPVTKSCKIQSYNLLSWTVNLITLCIMDLDKRRTSFLNTVTTGTTIRSFKCEKRMMLLYVIHHTIVLQCTANMPEGASVSLLQTKTLFVRVKRVLFSCSARWDISCLRGLFQEKWNGAKVPTLCQQTKKKAKSVFWLELEMLPWQFFMVHKV